MSQILDQAHGGEVGEAWCALFDGAVLLLRHGRESCDPVL